MVQKDLYLRNLHLLKLVFGREYSIAIASDDSDGELWQVMPDDLQDYPFFDWYCFIRPDHQFFYDMDMAVANYIQFYIVWVERGMPTNKDEFKTR